jgi:Leucine-rich repeat (LRR) protein
MFKNNKNLKVLELGSLSINQNNLKENEILLPETLKELNLTAMPFSYIPFNLDACSNTLNSLVFSGVEWPYPRGYGNPIVQFDRLLRYVNFIINDEQKQALINHFDNKKKAGLDSDDIYKFSAFLFKRFPRFSQVPSIIFKLTNLTSLDLSFQAIKQIPDEIGMLKSLNRLILNSCIVLESISGSLGSLPIKELRLEDCLSLKTPPPEIVKRGTISVLAYLKRLLTGSVLCKRTKLMLVSCLLIEK